MTKAQLRLLEIVKDLAPGACTGQDILAAEMKRPTSDWTWHTTQGVHMTAASLVKRGHLIKGKRKSAVAYVAAGRREIAVRASAPAGDLPTFSKLMGRVFS